VTTHALVALSHAWGRHDVDSFRAAQRSSLRRGLLTALSATGLAAVAEPVALPFYYHHPLRLSVLLLASMAVSTVITVVAVVAIQPLLASGQGRPAALSWLAGAAATVLALSLSSGTDWLACASLVGGPAVALAGALFSVRKLTHLPVATPVPTLSPGVVG
jgi:O-antigen/teichoic acid export membrane protein